jgi:hypothetical protein
MNWYDLKESGCCQIWDRSTSSGFSWRTKWKPLSTLASGRNVNYGPLMYKAVVLPTSSQRSIVMIYKYIYINVFVSVVRLLPVS